jgi:hypothetical protein
MNEVAFFIRMQLVTGFGCTWEAHMCDMHGAQGYISVYTGNVGFHVYHQVAKGWGTNSAGWQN